MTTGDGIFSGFFFLGLIWLYVATRDRWNWIRIGKWTAALTATPLIAIGVYIAGQNYLDSRPVLQTEFWGVAPGISKSELTFKKGKPDVERERYWTYGKETDSVIYHVQLRNEKVRAVVAASTNSYGLPYLQGISNHSSQSDIERKFGKPDSVSETKDKTTRMLTYLKYGIFFSLAKDRVEALGVVDPAEGPMLFSE